MVGLEELVMDKQVGGCADERQLWDFVPFDRTTVLQGLNDCSMVFDSTHILQHYALIGEKLEIYLHAARDGGVPLVGR